MDRLTAGTKRLTKDFTLVRAMLSSHCISMLYQMHTQFLGIQIGKPRVSLNSLNSRFC